ncbi:MAG: protein kinase [Chloroflexi bacterium]|nr:protein kinase [Chloroflexota bacterium]
MIGTILENRYRLDAELGHGGMGTVYRAHDTRLERDVAVKVMTKAALGTEGRARLMREARATAKLNHPNIISVHDAGEAKMLAQADTSPFIVMEFAKGQSLHDHRPETLSDVLSIARQICAALDHAHVNGIIHRDLKPENVMILPDGTAKLVDFGLARSVTSRLTTEGTLIGTVFYLAPEQALGAKIDHRADLYALGVTLYELTTGVLPFTTDDPFAVITQHLHAPVVPPRAKNDQISPALNDLIVQLLSKDPADRPSSAAEVLRTLEQPNFLEKDSAPIKELSLLDRIVRGRLVGRERELAEGRALWKKAVAGESQMLLVSGEPGIGKSRLVRELVTQAEVSGGRALVGVSYAEGDAPYAAFRQIIRQALRSDSGNDFDLPKLVLADLLTLIPELRPHYLDVPANLPLDPQAEQYRLYESVATFCAALSERVPLMLVFEDVHWADGGMLALLYHLARSTRRRRLLIVATYREIELDQSRPFQNVLLDLNRERLATRLKLPRLNRAQTGEVLEILFDEQITPTSLDSIYRETEGNPFFIEEVCKALVESGKLYYEDGRWCRPDTDDLGIPQSVRTAIQSRVRKLSATTQETLCLAAVMGREFDFDTLAEASQLDEDSLINELEAAERAQLIEELSGERGGTFIFAHALIPATLAEDLSGLRRRRIHRRVMTAIERLRPDDFEPLAHHALKGGDLKNGLKFSLRAAEKAHRLFAIEEALFHYDHAHEIAESLDLSEQLLSIYQVLGDIQGFRDSSQSIDAYERALSLAPDAEKRASIKAKIGMRHAYDANEQGLGLLEDAINELNPDTQGNELALATASLGRFYHNRGQHRRALAYLEQARQIAEPLDDPRLWHYVCIYLAGAHQQLAEFDKSMEWARHSITFGEQNSYPPSIAIGYEYLTEASVLMGKWQDALKFAEQEIEIAKNTGQLIAVSWAERNLADTCYGLGDLRAAKDAIQKSLDMAKAMGNFRLAVNASARLSIIQTDLGQVELAGQNARNVVEQASDFDQILIMVWSSLYALAY